MQSVGKMENESFSWAAYHACRSMESYKKTFADLSALLPIWRKESKSSAMIRHAFNDVYAEFVKGNFVVSRTTKPFSSMGLDQRHEQFISMQP